MICITNKKEKKRKITKKEFVTKCGELLHDAKPQITNCEYMLGSEIDSPTPGNVILRSLEYAVITCKNGYKYYLDITGRSLHSIAVDIFAKMKYK